MGTADQDMVHELAPLEVFREEEQSVLLATSRFTEIRAAKSLIC